MSDQFADARKMPQSKLNPGNSASTGSQDAAADYVWTGWGRPGRCLPVDGESVGSYECAFCEREITRDMTLEQADAPCRKA